MQAVCELNPPLTPSVGGEDFGLTARELRVIALVCAGYTDKDVAQKLEISENTAKYHLTNVFGKLEVTDRLELILFALDRGLIQEN